LLPDIVRSKFESKELVVRYPNSTRPWQHALDPLLGYLAAVATPREREFLGSNSFNFGPDSASLKVSQVVEIAQRHWMNQIAVKYEIGENQRYEASRLDLNSELSKQAFGWIPVWNQNDAIVRTLSWWDSINEFDLTPGQACQIDINFAISKWGL
jgi:CDP-glucose 4,6-dehydratase